MRILSHYLKNKYNHVKACRVLQIVKQIILDLLLWWTDLRHLMAWDLEVKLSDCYAVNTESTDSYLASSTVRSPTESNRQGQSGMQDHERNVSESVVAFS